MQSRHESQRLFHRALTKLRPGAFAVCAVLSFILCLTLAADALGIMAPEWEPLLWLTSPQSWAGILVVLAALSGTIVFARKTRPVPRTTKPLAAVLVFGCVTVGLGLASYWNCFGHQSPLWTPLSWTVALVGGSLNMPFGQAEYPGCRSTMPNALQVARLCAQAALLIGVAGVTVALFRTQLHRMRTRHSSRLTIVSGVETGNLDLLPALAGRIPRRSKFVIMEPLDDPAPARAARQCGGMFVIADPSQFTDLASLFGLRGDHQVDALYLIASDAGTNLARLDGLRRFFAGRLTTADGPQPRAVVRIDDHWQAEDWRRAQLADHLGWVSDAYSCYAVTARALLNRADGEHSDQILLVGSSPLALAVCSAHAQMQREHAVYDENGRASLPPITLIDPAAPLVLADHALTESSFGTPQDGMPVIAHSSPPTVETILELAHSALKPVVLLTDPPNDMPSDLARRLAARRRGMLMFAFEQAQSGISELPIVGRLHTFGLTLVDRGQAPEDSWTRIARLMHERFRKLYGGADPARPSLLPWDSGLDSFYRDTNIRHVLTTLRSVETIGLTWVGTDTYPQESRTADVPTTAEFEVVAREEHKSWTAHHLANGWSHGPRDDARHQHPDLVPWENLSEQARAKCIAEVRDSFELLNVLGYHATRIPAAYEPNDQWQEYKRVGTVKAVRILEPEHWTTPSGQRLTARAGDWMIWDDDGSTWSVDAEVFAQAYRRVHRDRWERVGCVHARRASDGEKISTLEGPVTASETEWILRGPKGEYWAVPDAHFRATYEPTNHR